MKDKIKEFRLNITIPAIFTVIVGALLLIYPVESLATISKVIAIIIILSGIFIVINQVFERGFDNGLGIAVGVIVAIFESMNAHSSDEIPHFSQRYSSVNSSLYSSKSGMKQ